VDGVGIEKKYHLGLVPTMQTLVSHYIDLDDIGNVNQHSHWMHYLPESASCLSFRVAPMKTSCDIAKGG
jgi:hypothetical protein